MEYRHGDCYVLAALLALLLCITHVSGSLLLLFLYTLVYLICYFPPGLAKNLRKVLQVDISLCLAVRHSRFLICFALERLFSVPLLLSQMSSREGGGNLR